MRTDNERIKDFIGAIIKEETDERTNRLVNFYDAQATQSKISLFKESFIKSATENIYYETVYRVGGDHRWPLENKIYYISKDGKSANDVYDLTDIKDIERLGASDKKEVFEYSALRFESENIKTFDVENKIIEDITEKLEMDGLTVLDADMNFLKDYSKSFRVACFTVVNPKGEQVPKTILIGKNLIKTDIEKACELIEKGEDDPERIDNNRFNKSYKEDWERKCLIKKNPEIAEDFERITLGVKDLEKFASVYNIEAENNKLGLQNIDKLTASSGYIEASELEKASMMRTTINNEESRNAKDTVLLTKFKQDMEKLYEEYIKIQPNILACDYIDKNNKYNEITKAESRDRQN